MSAGLPVSLVALLLGWWELLPLGLVRRGQAVSPVECDQPHHDQKNQGDNDDAIVYWVVPSFLQVQMVAGAASGAGSVAAGGVVAVSKAG